MIDQTIPTDTNDDEDSRRRGLLWLWLAIVVVLLAGLLAAVDRLSGCRGDAHCSAFIGSGTDRAGDSGASLASEAQSAQSTSPDGVGATSVAIRVTGTERGGLAPGVTTPVVVAITNTSSHPARITSARVSVGDASASCTAAESIRATRYDAGTSGAKTYDIPAGAAVRIPLAISMLDLPSNQNACKNARFPLTFHATAQQG